MRIAAREPGVGGRRVAWAREADVDSCDRRLNPRCQSQFRPGEAGGKRAK